MDDAQLLAEFVTHHSQAAFAALVARHLPLVYSSARRQVRDGHLAEDVAQAVFLVLAQKADTIRNAALLPAWLLKVTHYACADVQKSTSRRLKREQEAATMNPRSTIMPAEPGWDELSPHIDDAMRRLSDRERAAVLARYVQQQPLTQIAAAWCTSEATAKKRTTRALAKLRRLLTRRGAAASPAVLAGLLATHCITPAPAALAATVTTAAFATESAGASAVIAKGVLHMMLWNTVKLGAAAVLAIILAIGSTVVVVRQGLAQAAAASPAQNAAPPCAVTLPSGYKVELIAVGDVPRPDKPNIWWKPDGTPLKDFDYRFSIYSSSIPAQRTLAYRITTPSGESTGRTERLRSQSEYDLTPVMLGAPNSGNPMVSVVPDPSGILLDMPRAAQTASIRIELATGPWRTRATATGDSHSTTIPLGKDLIEIRTRDVGNQNRWVEAVDSLTSEAGRLWVTTDRRTYAGLARGDGGPFRLSGELQVTSDQKIKKIEFQTRPYNEFVEFSNVSLVSGAKSQPQIRAGTIGSGGTTPTPAAK